MLRSSVTCEHVENGKEEPAYLNLVMEFDELFDPAAN
jgi:hypothetical protein